MIHLLIVFICGMVVGASFGAITAAAVASVKHQALPQWSDFWEPRS
jgi:predicted acylesterase/phospholipase RssA